MSRQATELEAEMAALTGKITELQQRRATLADKIGAENASDITRWYAQFADAECPNCGVDFRNCPPELNLYPHWTGACKEVRDDG